MKTSPRSSRLAPALAAAAVAIAALCAAAAGWTSRHAAAAASDATLQAQRPAADAPVDVVKAPPGPERWL
jgi:hypothetical protein